MGNAFDRLSLNCNMTVDGRIVRCGTNANDNISPNPQNDEIILGLVGNDFIMN